MTSATPKFLLGKPLRDDTGAALTRQQLAWLGGTGAPIAELAAPEAESYECH
jgi:hypothetical protein